MATAGAVVDRLLRRLASDARRLKLPMKIYEDVAHMTRTLSRLQDVLVSVERQYFEVRTELQNWMRKIEQTACDMEDLLDGFENHYSTGSQSTAKATSFCSSGSFFLHSTKANRMKTLRRRVDNLAKDSVIFNLTQNPRCDLEKSDNQEEFYTVAIVGRDHDKAKIENLILQSDADRLSIIPIVGLVGVGKTALARSIFCDRVEGWSLDIHIWVKLNRKLNLKDIAAEIISQANETKEVRPVEIQENLQLLKNRLQEALHDKSCLIVLDGLCSTDKSLLDELKEMLRGTNKCIKVLVTTSNEITAELMHTVPPYKLLPLSEDDCWTIFSAKAFGDGDSVNACLKEIGKQIVKRCKGIPALAQSLGSIVHNQVMNVWLAARDEAIWELEKAYSTKIEVFSPFNQIYYDMPSALKLCFLYLSVFSKGSVIDKEKLIRQWIALDMIGSKYETLPSYVHGEMYIQDLLSIHFFQVQKTHSVNGMENMIAPTTLYMHNFVHDFARHVACNDIIILDDREMSSSAKKHAFQYALLTYYTGQSTLCSSLLTRARALHFQNSESVKLHRETFKLLKHLRVLNLGGSCIGEIPASVGHLKHLRYLDISDLKIQTLPSSMSNLTNLEALDLSNTSLKELPSFIGSLEKLKYLNLQGCDMLQNLPATLGHLQRLEHLRLSCCYDAGELADFLCNLQDLRFLDFSSCTELLELPPSFGNLMNLEDLNLSGCFNLKQLPESFGNLYFLRLLNISSCYELQQLPVSLCNLVKLEVLILRRCRRLQSLSPSFGNFPNLRILDLAGCEALHVSTGMLATNLEYLNLQQCLKLQTQPNHFSNFTKLKFLNLSQCMPAVDCLQSLDYLFNLEYLNLSHNQLGIPVSLARLQKLHTLDLTGCILEHPSHSVTRVILDICKMTRLEVLLTKDPMIVASLPPYIRYSVSIDDQWHMSTDELIISDLTRGPGGLNIAERMNLQNRPELRSLTLEWAYTSHPAAHGVIEDLGEEVLEKLQPHRSLEHFELVGYSGFVCPTWMMENMVTLLPNLVSLHLFNLGNCKNLPPLGQLLNLRHLHIKEMPNLGNLEMGLSGVAQSFKKLTHLKLESLLNLEELPILLSTNNENQQFMFPALEELSVLSCSKLIFKPSLPKCAKYEIKDSSMILSCGEPLGPLSSPSPADILITGCRVTSSCLQWLNSLHSLEKVVISACVIDDGEAATSFKLLEIKDTQESSGGKIPNENTNQSSSDTNISHELTTQDSACKNTVGAVDSYGDQQSSNESPLQSSQQNPPTTRPSISIIRKLFSRFNITSGQSVYYDIPSTETPPTSHKLSTSKLSRPIPGVQSLNLSLKQVQKATRTFSPSLKLGGGQLWTVYKAILEDNQFVIVKRANKGCVQAAKNCIKVQLLAAINHWSLVRFLGFIDRGNEFIMINEYVPNGTLRQHLHGRHTKPLDINQRIVIAIDVAIALTYLHLSTGETIVHSDLKTAKILLTETYRVKVGSSELSIGGTVGRVTGTLGYRDPEIMQNFELTAKSNVYSFGIILLEIISSRAPYEWNYEEIGDFNDQPYGSRMYDVLAWVLKKFKAGHMEAILDDCLVDHVDEIFLRDWFSLVSWCTASKGDVRPRIEEVGSRLWKIWKDHRERIGEPYEYERSWEEFVNEGILSGVDLMHEGEGTACMEFPGKGNATEPQDWPDASDQQLGSPQENYYYGSPNRSDITPPPSPLSPR